MAEMEELSESLGVQGYRDLVFDLCDEGGPTLAGLRKALDTGDAEAIAGKAHEIKGAALTLGLGVMAAVAQDLEDAREDVERREAHWIRLVALLPGLRAHAISASRRDA
jgi:HPt (histidine-containing phosphotransfer) domain-containing protein